MTKYDLDKIQKMVNYQALRKDWKTEKNFCLKRLKQEVKELEEALNKQDTLKIGEEAIDVLYFLVQVVKDAAPSISLNASFESKYIANWFNKKKTEDEKGNMVLR